MTEKYCWMMCQMKFMFPSVEKEPENLKTVSNLDMP